MAKERFKVAADHQVEQTTHEVPEEHHVGQERSKRTRRLVMRLDADEYRRLERYAADKHLPVSSAARSLVMDGIRRA